MTEILVCPECGEARFSWIVSIVQFGTVQKTHDGDYIEEGEELGAVAGDDVDESGVYCTGCDEFRERDDLIPDGEYDGTV